MVAAVVVVVVSAKRTNQLEGDNSSHCYSLFLLFYFSVLLRSQKTDPEMLANWHKLVNEKTNFTLILGRLLKDKSIKAVEPTFFLSFHFNLYSIASYYFFLLMVNQIN